MQARDRRDTRLNPLDAPRQRNSTRTPLFRIQSPAKILASLVIFAAIPFSVGTSQGQSGSSSTPPGKPLDEIRAQQNPRFSTSDLENAPKSALDQKRLAEINAIRKKQMAEDTEKLIALANELKADIDKTGQDTLSMNIVRKAEQIEKLAKSVKQKMRASLSNN